MHFYELPDMQIQQNAVKLLPKISWGQQGYESLKVACFPAQWNQQHNDKIRNSSVAGRSIKAFILYHMIKFCLLLRKILFLINEKFGNINLKNPVY